MCGIFAVFEATTPVNKMRQKLIQCSSRLRHRGPDWSGYVCEEGLAIGHERLSIIDPESGAQPLKSRDGTIVLAVNGEIYNYKKLQAEVEGFEPTTGSDCEIIIPLYEKFGFELFPKLRGMFSFVLYDSKKKLYLACRDHVGITPLYIGWGKDGSVWFASEMKALADQCANFQQFPPGHFYRSDTKEFSLWYKPAFNEPSFEPTLPVDYAKLAELLTTSVRQRLMCDVPWGVLLSGGLDSSLIASIASREFKIMQAEDPDRPWFPKMHSFSIGLEGSPDLENAKVVADFLGTVHHTYKYTIQEGLDAVRQVIFHLETYDVTTIRAATPMFLLSRKIKSMGIKMVLSGEGADEIFGGYLYFHKAPNAKEFFDETRDKLKDLHKFDCLRANKATSAWGLEPRVPFLDQDFLNYVMAINPEEKMIKEGRMEKYILRKAFDTAEGEEPFLPQSVLWRQKEQFSDGVGYGWIDALRDEAAEHVSDQMLLHAQHRFPVNTPATKEAYWYRTLFEDHYPQPAASRTVPGGPSIACSTARAIQWSAAFQNRADCSGRSVLGVHNQAYDAGWSVAPSNSSA